MDEIIYYKGLFSCIILFSLIFLILAELLYAVMMFIKKPLAYKYVNLYLFICFVTSLAIISKIIDLNIFSMYFYILGLALGMIYLSTLYKVYFIREVLFGLIVILGIGLATRNIDNILLLFIAMVYMKSSIFYIIIKRPESLKWIKLNRIFITVDILISIFLIFTNWEIDYTIVYKIMLIFRHAVWGFFFVSLTLQNGKAFFLIKE